MSFVYLCGMRHYLALILLALSVCLNLSEVSAQDLDLEVFMQMRDTSKVSFLPQVNLPLTLVVSDELKNIPKENLYQLSGITPISIDKDEYRFAVVSDKYTDGLLELSLFVDEEGKVVLGMLSPLDKKLKKFQATDPEGIAYDPVRKKYYISTEQQKILRLDSKQNFEGFVSVPEYMSASHIQANMGFESLEYDKTRDCLWVTNEGSLKEDVNPDSKNPVLRLQTIGLDGRDLGKYTYVMDPPRVPEVPSGTTYVHGVSDLTVLPDGRLVVMEREVFVNLSLLMVHSRTKLYTVNPEEGSETLTKTLLTEFTTGLDENSLDITLANYEGMCYVTLPDGSDALVLISDSQGRPSYSFLYGFLKIQLSDFIQIIKLKDIDGDGMES